MSPWLRVLAYVTFLWALGLMVWGIRLLGR
jgi:hypothetical protein